MSTGEHKCGRCGGTGWATMPPVSLDCCTCDGTGFCDGPMPPLIATDVTTGETRKLYVCEKCGAEVEHEALRD